MPASASFLIQAAATTRPGARELPDPVAELPGLLAVLDGVVNRQATRGSIAEWAADLPIEVARILARDCRAPCESTIRRVLGALDGDGFDLALSAWIPMAHRRGAPHSAIAIL